MRIIFSGPPDANSWKFVLPIMIVVCLATAGASIYLPRAMSSAAADAVYRADPGGRRNLLPVRGFFNGPQSLVAKRIDEKPAVHAGATQADRVSIDGALTPDFASEPHRAAQTPAVLETYLANAERESTIAVRSIQVAAGLILAALFGAGLAAQRRARQNREVLENLHYLAHHDTMTGALKRSSFVARLEALLHGDSSETGIALHYVDVDHLKTINDRFGHACGNAAVAAVAETLKGLAGERGFVGRIGGGEFMVVLAENASARDVAETAEAILRCFEAPILVEDRYIALSVSIGSVLLDGTKWSAEQAIRKADVALCQAKQAGRGQHHVYEESRGMALNDRRVLEHRIWEATRAGAFELQYQPIFGAQDRSVKGFEALLRLPDGEGGVIAPTDFVPLAEQIGAVPDIGKWVIREACTFASRLPDGLFVAVNVSPSQFAAGGVLEAVKAGLDEYELSGDKLELEITETLFFDRTPDVLVELEALRRLGVSIAIDDFGTGYANLSYFADIPFAKIKIDRAFVVGWQRGDASAVPVLETIVSLCRSMKVAVTCEGIETLEQADYFASLGCDYLQGYHLARPLPEHELGPILLRFMASKGGRTQLPKPARSA